MNLEKSFSRIKLGLSYALCWAVITGLWIIPVLPAYPAALSTYPQTNNPPATTLIPISYPLGGTNYLTMNLTLSNLSQRFGLTNIAAYGANGGASDDTAAFQTAANAGGALLAPYTTYTINGNVQVTNGTRFIGDGTTRIKFGASGTGNMFASSATNSDGSYVSNVVFKGIVFDGGRTGFTGTGDGFAGSVNAWNWSSGTTNVTLSASITNRTGLYLAACISNCLVEDCSFNGFSDAGLRFYSPFQFPQPITPQATVSKCSFNNNWIGLHTLSQAEYLNIIGGQFEQNGYAFYNGGGNDNVTGVNMTRNGIAAYVTGYNNGAHGAWVSCSFNHDDIRLVESGESQGDWFSACVFLGGGGGGGTTGWILGRQADAVLFDGCFFSGGTANIDFNGTNLTSISAMFNNCFSAGGLLITTENGAQVMTNFCYVYAQASSADPPGGLLQTTGSGSFFNTNPIVGGTLTATNGFIGGNNITGYYPAIFGGAPDNVNPTLSVPGIQSHEWLMEANAFEIRNIGYSTSFLNMTTGGFFTIPQQGTSVSSLTQILTPTNADTRYFPTLATLNLNNSTLIYSNTFGFTLHGLSAWLVCNTNDANTAYVVGDKINALSLGANAVSGSPVNVFFDGVGGYVSFGQAPVGSEGNWTVTKRTGAAAHPSSFANWKLELDAY